MFGHEIQELVMRSRPEILYWMSSVCVVKAFIKANSWALVQIVPEMYFMFFWDGALMCKVVKMIANACNWDVLVSISEWKVETWVGESTIWVKLQSAVKSSVRLLIPIRYVTKSLILCSSMWLSGRFRISSTVNYYVFHFINSWVVHIPWSNEQAKIMSCYTTL